MKAPLLSIPEAQRLLFDLARPVGEETVALAEAAGRVLAAPITAERDQPPFAASAMDGYALKSAEVRPGARFHVIGEAAAGAAHARAPGPGEAVRIFTGAPLPEGTDRVIIQEDVTRSSEFIILGDHLDTGPHVRPAGADFTRGFTLGPQLRLSPAHLALAAAMNAPRLTVSRRPEVALIATGDELVMPGEHPGPDQIIASNSFGLKALCEAEGAHVRLLPIARDTETALHQAFDLARGADLVVTIGGASVGDHDLVADAAAEAGLERAFYKVAMRPGKPLMAGRMDDVAMVGLPGNPVSAMVCGHLFILPMLRKMLGLDPALPERTARLTTDLPANGPREHYMRAHVSDGEIRAFSRQDSALLTVLSEANALLIHPPGAPARAAGETVRYLPL